MNRELALTSSAFGRLPIENCPRCSQEMFGGNGQSSIDNVAPRCFTCNTLEGSQKVITANSHIAWESTCRKRFC